MKGAIDTGKLRPNQGRTNQKLYFAKLQLDRIASLLADKSAYSWEAEALSSREAALMHLHGAYLAFLQELVRFYKLSGPLLSSEALRVAMESKGQISPEISVLQSLEQNAASWLAQLLSAHQCCLVAPDPASLDAPVDDVEPLGRAIGLVAIVKDEPLSVTDLHSIQSWHGELTIIIRGFRGEMAEW